MIKEDHELHKRRGASNMKIGLVLGGFVLLVFAITVSKMMDGQDMRSKEHIKTPVGIPIEEAQ